MLINVLVKNNNSAIHVLARIICPIFNSQGVKWMKEMRYFLVLFDKIRIQIFPHCKLWILATFISISPTGISISNHLSCKLAIRLKISTNTDWNIDQFKSSSIDLVIQQRVIILLTWCKFHINQNQATRLW